MTGPDRSKLPKGFIVPLSDGKTRLVLNISKLGTLSQFPEEYDPLFTLCGRIILEWSMVQEMVEILITHTWRNEVVAGIEEAERPKSIKMKLAFLRKAFRTDGPLGEISCEVRNVIKFVRQTSLRRHDIAHLSLAKITKEEGDFALEMFSLEGRHIVIHASQMKELLSDIYECQNALMAVTWNHAALFHKVAQPR